MKKVMGKAGEPSGGVAEPAATAGHPGDGAAAYTGGCGGSLRYPLGRYRAAISVFFFLQGTVFATWSARIPDVKQALSLNDAQLGTILFFFPLGQLVSVPLSGYLVQKYSSRALLLCVALLYPLSLVGIGLMPTRAALAGMLFLLGVAANLHNLAANTQAVGLEKRYGRSIIGTFHGMWSLAGFVAGLTSSFLAVRHVTPFWHFCGVFGFGLLAVTVLHRFLLPEDLAAGATDTAGAESRRRSRRDIRGGEPQSLREATGGGTAAVDGAEEAVPAKEKATFNIFRGMDRYLCLLGFLAFGCMLCEGSVYDWSAVYFGQTLKVDPVWIRAGYTGCMLAMASMRFLADGLVNRIGAVKVVRVSGFFIAIGFLTAVLFPRLLPATVGFVLVGLGISSVVPICYGMVKNSRAMSAGRAINAVSTIGFFGFVAGPPVVGYISEWLGMRLAFALVACIGLLTGLLAGKLKLK
ncbi:MAG: MFS transporter [Bacteroidales bacterium]|nr:MFS transporter [Bacteroidales bacterium]